MLGDELYLTFLSRFPTVDERQFAVIVPAPTTLNNVGKRWKTSRGA